MHLSPSMPQSAFARCFTPNRNAGCRLNQILNGIVLLHVQEYYIEP